MKIAAGYSGTPLWKKLGYVHAMTACVDGAPDQYQALLSLPKEMSVTWCDTFQTGARFVHLFTASRTKLNSALVEYRKKIASDCVVWISWPKKSSGVKTDITEDTIREIALPLGFVDIKVCAIDEVWSGLKLMVRKELR